MEEGLQVVRRPKFEQLRWTRVEDIGCRTDKEEIIDSRHPRHLYTSIPPCKVERKLVGSPVTRFPGAPDAKYVINWAGLFGSSVSCEQLDVVFHCICILAERRW